MIVENYYVSYKGLFESIVTHQFPREKDGLIIWEDARYNTNLYLMWDTYYNKLIDIEKMVVYLHNIQDYNIMEYYETLLRIAHHRMKFVLRIYRLGIIDYLTYKLLRNSEGWHGVYINHASEIIDYCRLTKKYFKGKFMTILSPILSCQIGEY